MMGREKDTETRSLTTVSNMATQSLSPAEYEHFKGIHDALVLRRSLRSAVLQDYVIDKAVSCVTCKAVGGAWIYCPILTQMQEIDGFDETGETHGCNAHTESDRDK